MSQLSIFEPVTCPCGDIPAIRENEVILWCARFKRFEGDSLAESMSHYNEWRNEWREAATNHLEPRK